MKKASLEKRIGEIRREFLFREDIPREYQSEFVESLAYIKRKVHNLEDIPQEEWLTSKELCLLMEMYNCAAKGQDFKADGDELEVYCLLRKLKDIFIMEN